MEANKQSMDDDDDGDGCVLLCVNLNLNLTAAMVKAEADIIRFNRPEWVCKCRNFHAIRIKLLQRSTHLSDELIGVSIGFRRKALSKID